MRVQKPDPPLAVEKKNTAEGAEDTEVD